MADATRVSDPLADLQRQFSAGGAAAPTQRMDPLAELQRQLNTPAPPPPAPVAPAPSRDPVTRGMTALGAQLPAGTPDWLRTVGGFVLPQTTPELVATLATLPIGGVAGGLAAKAGVPLVSKLAAKSVPAFLGRTALTGGATAAAGAATGHDPLASGMTGVASRAIGEPLGALAGKAVQSAVSNRLLGNVTARVSGAMRDIIGEWLPKGATDQRVIQSIVADEPSQAVGAKIGELRKTLGDTLINVMDLKPLLDKQGVMVYGAAAKEGAEGTAARVKDLGMVWPPTRTFEGGVTPGTAMAPFGTVAKTGAEGAKAIGPGSALAPRGALVPWGTVDTAIEDARKLLGPITTPEAVQQLHILESLRAKAASRVGSKDLTDLLQEYGRTKSLRDWMWGIRGATPAYGEKVVVNLIGDGGNLSPSGFNDLVMRFQTNAPRIHKVLGPEHVARLSDAIGWDPARGLARIQVGEGLKALVPAAVSFATGGRHWAGHELARQTPRVFSHVPGWEASQTLAQRAYPALTRGAVPGPVGTVQEELLGGTARQEEPKE